MATSTTSSSSSYSKRPRNSAFYNSLNKVEEGNEEDGKEERDESDERLMKRLYAPTVHFAGDSRWRCVPGAITSKCVEYKVGDEDKFINSTYRGRLPTEEEKLRSLKNVGIYRDYPSVETCEANCIALPTDPLTLAFSMLNSKDVRNAVRTVRVSSQAVSQLQDTFKEAKEAQLLEQDIVRLLAVFDVLDFEQLQELAQRTFFDHIELGQGRLFSERISSSVIDVLDAFDTKDSLIIRTLKLISLRSFIITKLFQIGGWEISKSDRIYLFLKWMTSRTIDAEKVDKTEWLKLGLLKTLNSNSPLDQKLVLRKIAVLSGSSALIWRLSELIPYFKKYDFANDPILVGYLWTNYPWNFELVHDKIGFLNLITALWELWDAYHISLMTNVNSVEGIDAGNRNQLVFSPIFDEESYTTAEKKYAETPVETDNLLHKFVIFLTSLTQEQYTANNETIERAVRILARQPYFSGSNSDELTTLFPFLLQEQQQE